MKQERSHKQIAFQRHADYYMGLLMDPENTPEDLYIELGQMQLAFKRIQEEEVGSNFHPGELEIKLRQVSGGHAEKFLPKLFYGTATSEDVNDLEMALTAVALGHVEYPVALDILTGKFQQIYDRKPNFTVKLDSEEE